MKIINQLSIKPDSEETSWKFLAVLNQLKPVQKWPSRTSVLSSLQSVLSSLKQPRPSPSVILVGDGVIVSVHRSLDNRCLMRTLCQSGPERDLIHEAQQNPALDPIRIKLKGTLIESGNFKLKAETSPEFVTDPKNSEPDLNEAGSVCWWIWITCSCCTWVTWINSQKRPF